MPIPNEFHFCDFLAIDFDLRMGFMRWFDIRFWLILNVKISLAFIYHLIISALQCTFDRHGSIHLSTNLTDIFEIWYKVLKNTPWKSFLEWCFFLLSSWYAQNTNAKCWFCVYINRDANVTVEIDGFCFPFWR